MNSRRNAHSARRRLLIASPLSTLGRPRQHPLLAAPLLAAPGDGSQGFRVDQDGSGRKGLPFSSGPDFTEVIAANFGQNPEGGRPGSPCPFWGSGALSKGRTPPFVT